MANKLPFQIAKPVLTTDTLDRYWVKHSILEAVESALPQFTGTLLDIGCGEQPYRALLTSPPSGVTSYLGLDLEGGTYGGEGAPEPELRWDGLRIPLKDGQVDTAFATEVLEHCPDPGAILDEIHRVLRPGGRFFFTVPFLWPLHDSPHDHYRYTPFALRHLFARAGFQALELSALGGWDAALGQMLGLWVRRRPISSPAGAVLRKTLSLMALPVQRYLYRKDRRPETFESNPMITGISGVAFK